MTLCKKCGKREVYTFPNGRIGALCAVCGWNALVELVNSPDIQEPKNEPFEVCKVTLHEYFGGVCVHCGKQQQKKEYFPTKAPAYCATWYNITEQVVSASDPEISLGYSVKLRDHKRNCLICKEVKSHEKR